MPDTRDFYSNSDISVLKQVFGQALHYHFGLFENPTDTLEQALDQAVRQLYPFIPKYSRVLDLGCGWGGPAQLLGDEKHCNVTCISNAPTQITYIRELGLNAVEQDLSQGLPLLHQRFDVALMMESYSHIEQREQLLKELRQHAGTLVIRVNCTQDSHPEDFLAFAGTMRMPTPAELVGAIREAGWQPVKLWNIRQKTTATISAWHNRILQTVGDAPEDPHLAALLGLCQFAMPDLLAWAKSSPLITVIAKA